MGVKILTIEQSERPGKSNELEVHECVAAVEITHGL